MAGTSQGFLPAYSGHSTPAALAVGGDEFPLDLAGVRGSTLKQTITRISRDWDSHGGRGLRTMQSDISYTPVTFHAAGYLLVALSGDIEVETRHQHWRIRTDSRTTRDSSVNTKETQAANEQNISVSRAMTGSGRPRKRTLPFGHRLYDCGCYPDSIVMDPTTTFFPRQTRALSEARMA